MTTPTSYSCCAGYKQQHLWSISQRAQHTTERLKYWLTSSECQWERACWYHHTLQWVQRNQKPDPQGGGQPIHLTQYWALHGKGTRFTFVQLLLVEPVHYLFLHKSTHEFQSREPGRTEPGGTNQPVRVWRGQWSRLLGRTWNMLQGQHSWKA